MRCAGRARFGTLLSAFFLLLFTAAAARASCLSEVIQSLREKREVYVCYQCNTNVIQLARALRERVPDFDPQRAHVVYIFGPRGGVVRTNWAHGGFAQWSFHVVLEYEGKVLDLDAPAGAPPPPLAEYLGHFEARGGWTDTAPVFTRSVPFEDYAALYGRKEAGRGVIDYETFQDARALPQYPVLEAGQVIREGLPARRGAPPRPAEGGTLASAALLTSYDPVTRELRWVELRTGEYRYTFDRYTQQIEVYRRGVRVDETLQRFLFKRRLKQEAKSDPRFARIFK